VEQHVDVSPRDPEELRHVFTLSLLEHAKGDHRPLTVAELGDASTKTHVLFRAGEEHLARDTVVLGIDLFDRVVRAHQVVTPSPVPSRVPHHHVESGAQIGPPGAFVASFEVGAQGVVNGVEGILRRKSLLASDASQIRPLFRNGSKEGLQWIEHG